jgi:nicotinamidase-related amidase
MHLCVDMQRLFAEETPWKTPWLERVLPMVATLAAFRPDQLCFTRFIPADGPEIAPGSCRRYYQRWQSMTLAALDPMLLDLAEPLDSFAPPAPVFDKRTYSPWRDGGLHRLLREKGVDTLIITGAETEVRVAAAVLGAVDLGYRVVVATDAVCSSADPTHDAMIDIYHSRFSYQIETAEVGEIIDAWD